MELSKEEFELLRDYIHDICGLSIAENKAYLIRQRIEPLAVAEGCGSFREFHEIITRKKHPMYQERIINAITTNETAFFRDGHPFDAFRDYILKKLGNMIQERKIRPRPRKGPKVRIWSAGSSSGQEAYSIAMLIREYTSANRQRFINDEDFGILATDISSKMLAKAMAGEYNHAEIKRGLTPERVKTYFKALSCLDGRKTGTTWVINSSIRSMVEFRQINLIRPFIMLGGFDVIFCRNVLIYFDIETKSRIIDQFWNMLSDQGFLILGATENVYGITEKFDSEHYGQTLLYQKKAK